MMPERAESDGLDRIHALITQIRNPVDAAHADEFVEACMRISGIVTLCTRSPNRAAKFATAIEEPVQALLATATMQEVCLRANEDPALVAIRDEMRRRLGVQEDGYLRLALPNQPPVVEVFVPHFA
jgi:hypothetical protein